MAAAITQITVPAQKTEPTSRVVFTQGGKGGTGKTAFATMLVEWYAAHKTPCALIDMDTENKAQGSLAHFFPKARKSNIHLARELDQFVEVLDKGVPIVVADMGASAGDVAHEWFDSMHESASESGIAFTAIGIVTPDPASVASVLDWDLPARAGGLPDRKERHGEAFRLRLLGHRPASRGVPKALSTARDQHGIPLA
jgi:hypothetical protein